MITGALIQATAFLLFSLPFRHQRSSFKSSLQVLHTKLCFQYSRSESNLTDFSFRERPWHLSNSATRCESSLWHTEFP